MNCYFQGCAERGLTKEHIPPRSFFPDGEKQQLLTVRSCTRHNNSKSKDDLYVLAQICMNASPSNRAREVFLSKIVPQLSFNNSALRKRLVKGAVELPNGAVKYRTEIDRFDEFFSALSCGIVYKACGSSLPPNFEITHIYHNLQRDASAEETKLKDHIGEFYDGVRGHPKPATTGRGSVQNQPL